MNANVPSMAARMRAAGASSAATLRSPVLLWAGIGMLFLALAAYVWGSWLLSDQFRPVPVGSDPLPWNVGLAIRATEIIVPAIALFIVWKFIVAPWRRTGELSLDGLLVINFLLIWWTDPMDNYVTYSFMYNGHTVNMGNWGGFIPGWGSPNPQNFPEPLLMMGGFYLFFWMTNVVLGCWTLRKLQQRYPNLAMGWRLLILALLFAVIDLAIENAFMLTGVAAYPGSPRSWTMSAGKAWQWPLYEAGIIAAMNVGFTCLRFFKDDRGLTFVERGIERLQLTPRKRKLLSFLALAGFIQPFFVFGYYVPYNLFAMRADTFPAYPSYMRTGVCGEGTSYACPSYDWVPIPQRGAKLFIGPDDPRLPQAVRDAQGISAGGRDPYALE